nr:5-bromo-4-chloroindolyl phosphate hydrolysis family protein [Methylomarinum sp. Ch1-1]MDP4522635.1 5-bromo-4-chloroindolyl phosphate hydrolysis family protein [Methylomarinum sp. Ch1-1]
MFRTLEESALIIRDIEQANDKIENPELNQRIERICEIANGILAEIEADPRDIRRARKFLNVYLDGARKVTEGYARTHRHSQSGELEQNFRNVLATIESVFQEQKQKLLEDDVFDLDVQIEVLNTQLKREGIR